MNNPKTSGIEDVLFQSLLSLLVACCAEKYGNSKELIKFVFSP
jgi:hypothetical protein